MKKLTDTVIRELNSILLGKDHQVRLSLCGLLAKGHLLIEDIPGMGKTTLSHALAKVMGLTYQRIQFTNDLLPADVLGFSMYDKQAGSLVFHPGPIFAQVVLADEINRASPRTQSALLEAMEERQVSIEGETRPLPHPFFVIATQNPIEQGGTYPLPESQLDRFLMRIRLGYPDPRAERELLEGEDRRVMTDRLQSLLSSENLQTLQDAVNRVSTSPALLDYVRPVAQGRAWARARRTGMGPDGRSPPCLTGRHPGGLSGGRRTPPGTGRVRKERGESKATSDLRLCH